MITVRYSAAQKREAQARREAAFQSRRAREAALPFEEWLAERGWDVARVLGGEWEADLREEWEGLAG